MLKLALIAAGGAVGAVLRYVLSGLIQQWAGPDFPWGTLGVNVAGSFVIGLLWALAEYAPFGPRWTPFVFVGVIGAFTTFSTYALECVNLLRDGEVRLALLNLLASNLLALGAVVLGFFAARSLLTLAGR
ncbi:fluoride efflux transporter CrcB [Rhodocaloribacter litoris]|uniref:fluoride efflux transporter CrcB n=1 Tax=Rhodocaloribacter litoris TaxID=2558931 RepID=UPI0014223EA8|nr:fluoride efflux transporter CrcB [Rhodocaloribacter litoris]QXD14851.1 fluoride efflux transporter CrcB [Rhodocaloribacter litoris]